MNTLKRHIGRLKLEHSPVRLSDHIYHPYFILINRSYREWDCLCILARLESRNHTSHTPDIRSQFKSTTVHQWPFSSTHLNLVGVQTNANTQVVQDRMSTTTTISQNTPSNCDNQEHRQPTHQAQLHFCTQMSSVVRYGSFYQWLRQ